MTTTFEQMKAAVEAATKGEWSKPDNALTIYAGGYNIAAMAWLAGETEADITANLEQAKRDAAAIVAALNWLRGGGITSATPLSPAPTASGSRHKPQQP